MRVLILSPVYPRDASPGEGVFVEQHARALAERGMECTVVVCKPWLPEAMARRWGRYRHLSGLVSRTASDGVRVEFVRHVQFPMYRWTDVTVGSCARAVLRVILDKHGAKPFDVVQAQSVYPVGLAAPAVAHALGAPFVVTFHIQDDALLYEGAGRAQYGRMLEEASGLVAVGSPLKRFVNHVLGFQRKQVRIIPNGVNVEEIEEVRRSVPLGDGGNGLVSVSNLWKTKGIDVTLEALYELDRRGVRDWHYTIVGEGPERPRLERRTRELGIADRVTFKGALAHREALAEIAGSDIFVLPSWLEAFGVVYLEAMACGKPVIGCRGQGAEDMVVDGETGLLVEPQDVMSLTNALEELLRRPDEGKQMGERGRRRAQDFTWRENAMRYDSLYREVMNDGNEY